MENAFIKKQGFNDVYFNLEKTTVSEQFSEVIDISIAQSIRYEVYNKLVKQVTQIDHHCYECRKPISVDISRILKYNRDIKTEEYLCDSHKKDHQVSKNSVPFIRYETAFFYKLTKHLESLYIQK